jgi:hypothetical protein
MTKKQFAALGKQLLPVLDGYEVQGWLVFRSPIDHTLRGLCFERRELPTSFYLEVFFMPLCVPTDDITLNFGKRLGGGSHSWDVSDPRLASALCEAVTQEAVPFLSGLESPGDVINRIRRLRVPQDAFYVQQAIAYLQARYGSVPEAIESLGRTIASLRQGLQTDWAKRFTDRAILLQDKLIEDPAAARRLLDSWEVETLRNLKLERFRQAVAPAESAAHPGAM